MSLGQCSLVLVGNSAANAPIASQLRLQGSTPVLVQVRFSAAAAIGTLLTLLRNGLQVGQWAVPAAGYTNIAFVVGAGVNLALDDGGMTCQALSLPSSNTAGDLLELDVAAAGAGVTTSVRMAQVVS